MKSWPPQKAGFSLLDLIEPAINITSPNTTYALISLEPFQAYNPCQFDLSDKENHTLTKNSAAGLFTGYFNISDKSTSTAHVWSLQNPAPIYNTLSNTNAGCQMLGAGGGKLLWMAMLMVLLVGGLDISVLA